MQMLRWKLSSCTHNVFDWPTGLRPWQLHLLPRAVHPVPASSWQIQPFPAGIQTRRIPVAIQQSAPSRSSRLPVILATVQSLTFSCGVSFFHRYGQSNCISSTSACLRLRFLAATKEFSAETIPFGDFVLRSIITLDPNPGASA